MSEIILGIGFLVVLLLWVITDHAKEKKFRIERDRWESERKDLIDRIQAPSFAEYSSKVIREKKAENQKEEEPKSPYIA